MSNDQAKHALTPWLTSHIGRNLILDSHGRQLLKVLPQNRATDVEAEIRDRVITAVNAHAALLAEVAALKAHREALLKAAKAYEKFEGALVTSNEAWQDGAAPFPTFTQELYDEWIAIQTIRNAAIAAAEGEAKP